MRNKCEILSNVTPMFALYILENKQLHSSFHLRRFTDKVLENSIIIDFAFIIYNSAYYIIGKLSYVYRLLFYLHTPYCFLCRPPSKLLTIDRRARACVCVRACWRVSVWWCYPGGTPTTCVSNNTTHNLIRSQESRRSPAHKPSSLLTAEAFIRL